MPPRAKLASPSFRAREPRGRRSGIRASLAVALACASLATVAGCGKAGDGDLAAKGGAVPSAGVFRDTCVFVSEHYAPYEYIDASGAPAGPNIAILKEAARRAGVKVDFVFMPWARAEKMIRDGEADAIFSCMRTKDREAFLMYPATPIAMDVNAILALDSYEGSPGSLAELGTTPVGCVLGNRYGPAFDSNVGIVKREVRDQQTLITMLIAGRLEVIADNIYVARHYLKEYGYPGEARVLFKLVESPLYVAFSRASADGAALCGLFGGILADMQASGELDRIKRESLGPGY